MNSSPLMNHRRQQLLKKTFILLASQKMLCPSCFVRALFSSLSRGEKSRSTWFSNQIGTSVFRIFSHLYLAAMLYPSNQFLNYESWIQTRRLPDVVQTVKNSHSQWMTFFAFANSNFCQVNKNHSVWFEKKYLQHAE